MLIYVAHYKSGPHATEESGYRAVCNVTAEGARPAGFSHYDSAGGFPDKNRGYCELSVLRKLQNDRPDDVVGLVHYRRLFTTSASVGYVDTADGMRTVEHFDWANPGVQCASVADLTDALKDVDWIAPSLVNVCVDPITNALDQFNSAHDPLLLSRASAHLAVLHPGEPTLEEYLRSTRSIRPFNMFVTRRSLLDLCLNELWDLLEFLEVDNTFVYEDFYQARWPGFVAERFMSYWVDVILPAHGLRTRSLTVVFFENCIVQNSSSGECEVLGNPWERSVRFQRRRDVQLLRRLVRSIKRRLYPISYRNPRKI